MLHVAACIGSVFPRFFSKYKDNQGILSIFMQARKREVLSASIAAGIAVRYFAFKIEGVFWSSYGWSTLFFRRDVIILSTKNYDSCILLCSSFISDIATN
jgi:hypothetical protein